jgi:hypothetical protein
MSAIRRSSGCWIVERVESKESAKQPWDPYRLFWSIFGTAFRKVPKARVKVPSATLICAKNGTLSPPVESPNANRKEIIYS